MHTIGYIIETDDNVRLEYAKTSFVPYFQPDWEYGVNEFDNISDVDPNDVTTPDLVRVPNETDYDYYYKTLFVPWYTTSLRVSVLVDGVEGSNSFIYDDYTEFLKTKKAGSEIYVTVEKNKQREQRDGKITISYCSDDSINRTIRIVQDPCDIKLKIISCEINNGENIIEIPVASDVFEYQFDTLTDKTDTNRQSLKFTMDVRGLRNKFYIKSMCEYVEVGEIDDTYKYIDGKYYKRMQKYVNDNFVTYYDEAMVINNIAYTYKNYDNAFKVETPSNNTIVFTNFGRVFMENNAIYVITLANYDDINVICNIKLTYANNPTNLILS